MYDVYFEKIRTAYLPYGYGTAKVPNAKERFVVTHPDSKHVGKIVRPFEFSKGAIKGFIEGEPKKEHRFYYWQIDILDEQGRPRCQKYKDSLGRELMVGDHIYMVSPCPWSNNVGPEISVIRDISEKESITLEVLMRDGMTIANYMHKRGAAHRLGGENTIVREKQVPTKMIKLPMREDELSFLILNGYEVD